MSKIKFNLYYVTNGETKAKAWVCRGTNTDGHPQISIYAQDYSRNLGKIFGKEYQNDTDSMTDYFDEGRVVLRPGHPLFEAAGKAADRYAKKQADQQAKRMERARARVAR